MITTSPGPLAALLLVVLVSAPLAKAQFFGGPGLTWSRYTLTAIANGVNGCANANGCWQINGVLGANKAAGLTQAIVLYQIPARGHVASARVKTATAFTGTATATATLGTATNNTFFVSANYNLQTAVSDTNFSPTGGYTAFTGSTTHAAVNLVLALTTTVDNIDQIAAGSSVDVWVQQSVLP